MTTALARRVLVLLVCLGGAVSCADVAGGEKTGTFEHYVVASANPMATHAGKVILERGGTAIDAAVAVEAVLGLVEPQSSGLGGGAFLLYYDAKTRKLTSYDGREIAPAATRPDQFLGPDGMPKPFMEQVVGGKSVGVPGLVPMLALAQNEHGRLPWKDLFAPAIDLADNGFTVGARLNRLIGLMPTLRTQDAARKYFFTPDGTPLVVGTQKRNPEYAQTLQTLAADPKAMQSGPIAAAIVDTVVHAPKNPQAMTMEDLAAYVPRERAPVCARYHVFRICSMGPPSSGGTTVLATMVMLERFDLHTLGVKSAESWHLIAEAERLAYADRAQYVADPDFVRVPTQGLIDPGYLKQRSLLIDPERAAQGERAPGIPPMAQKSGAADTSYEFPSTSHFTIVDRYGDVASMTATVENAFGSNLMVDGFVLNNQLTDFSPLPTKDGKPVVNAAAPGKRPMSSMSPVIVFDDRGQIVMGVGSPGGRRIIGYVVKTLVAALDWNMPMQEAIDLPNVLNLNGPTEIEAGPTVAPLATALEAKGHTVKLMQGEESGLHGFHVVAAGFDAGADRRREGTVEGGRTWWPWRWIRGIFR